MDPKKVYWIGDNRGQKSALIGKRFYLPGDVIPVDEVEKSRLEDWKARGLVSGGAYSPPVIIKDTETINRLEAEVMRLRSKLEAMPALENQNRELKADVDRIPGLERDVSDLKRAAEKAKDGAKAKRVKELEAEISDLNAKITEIDLDNQEKAALIDKLNADLESATKPDDSGAGPGGS